MTFILGVDTPEPRCGRVSATQHLAVTNNSGATATVLFARETYSLQQGASIHFSAPFGFVWQPGVHDLQASLYAGSGPELWLIAPAVPANAPACETRRLKLLLSGPISEATGQHTTELAVQNTSRTACNLDGYPRVELLDRRHRVLPFIYHQGGDQMLTAQRPSRVGLPPFGFAYFAINKYRCDKGGLDAGTIMMVRQGGDDAQLTLSSGISVDYCGSGDPGTSIAISPFEINLIGTMSGA